MAYTPTYLTGFKPEHAALWSKEVCHVGHELHRSSLFSDDALIKLIETAPRESFNIMYMGEQGQPKRLWRHGELGDVSGADALEAIRSGRMWFNFTNVSAYSPEHRDLVEAVFDEQRRLVPGFSPRNMRAGVLISSPRAQVYYHCDVPGQSLWQIRGEKRVYIYPDREPFLDRAQFERVVLGETEEDIDFETWFDDYAQVYELKPGQMLHWPLNGPHRVENHDCLNVSMTTEHSSDEIRRSTAMNFANGVLRHRFGLTPKTRDLYGPNFWGKAALAVAWKGLGLHKKRRHIRTIDFRVAPQAPERIADIKPYQI